MPGPNDQPTPEELAQQQRERDQHQREIDQLMREERRGPPLQPSYDHFWDNGSDY